MCKLPRVLGKLHLALGVESSALGRPEEENMARICWDIIAPLGHRKGLPDLGGHRSYPGAGKFSMREELGNFRVNCKLCSFQLGLIIVRAAKFQLLSSKVGDISCVLSERCFSGIWSILGLSGERTWHRNSGRDLRDAGGCLGSPELGDFVQRLCFPAPSPQHQLSLF